MDLSGSPRKDKKPSTTASVPESTSEDLSIRNAHKYSKEGQLIKVCFHYFPL